MLFSPRIIDSSTRQTYIINCCTHDLNAGVCGWSQPERPGGAVQTRRLWRRCFPPQPPQDLLYPSRRRRARDGTHWSVSLCFSEERSYYRFFAHLSPLSSPIFSPSFLPSFYHLSLSLSLSLSFPAPSSCPPPPPSPSQ